MCVVQAKYQCGGVGNAFQTRCKCTTTSTVASATPWCHEYGCYRCRARFEGVPAADGAIYDYLKRFDSDDNSDPYVDDPDLPSRSEYTRAATDTTNVKDAQKEDDYTRPEPAQHRRQKTDQLHQIAQQISVPEKDIHKVAGLAFFWLDEVQRNSVGGCCWWYEETLAAASILAAACELHIPITLGFDDVTITIRDSLVCESQMELLQNFHVFFDHFRSDDVQGDAKGIVPVATILVVQRSAGEDVRPSRRALRNPPHYCNSTPLSGSSCWHVRTQVARC